METKVKKKKEQERRGEGERQQERENLLMPLYSVKNNQEVTLTR